MLRRPCLSAPGVAFVPHGLLRVFASSVAVVVVVHGGSGGHSVPVSNFLIRCSSRSILPRVSLSSWLSEITCVQRPRTYTCVSARSSLVHKSTLVYDCDSILTDGYPRAVLPPPPPAASTGLTDAGVSTFIMESAAMASGTLRALRLGGCPVGSLTAQVALLAALGGLAKYRSLLLLFPAEPRLIFGHGRSDYL